MADQSTTDSILRDTIVDISVVTYNTWREPKTYFPYGKGLKQTILQQFGPVLGALVFIVCLERGRVLALINQRKLAYNLSKSDITVKVDVPNGPVNTQVTSSKRILDDETPVKKRFTVLVEGQPTTFEYVDPPKGTKIKSLVSNGKKSAQAVWNNTVDGAKWLLNKTRSLFTSNGKSLKKGSAGMVGLVISALSYIDALSDLFIEVGTGSPTLIWHGMEDCRVKLINADGKSQPVFNEPYYIAKITVGNLAILAHYSYTGAIGGDLGYSLTQLWNIIGSDLTLLPDMTLTLAVLPGKKTQWKDESKIEKECIRLHEKWVQVSNDVTATAATFGNIAGFVPILVSIFAGKLGSSGKSIRAGLLLLLSNQIDNLTSKTTQSLEALSQ